MTRSDVFDNPLLRLFFNGVKMIPIYRKRDGGNTQEKNKAIFEKCTNALSRKDCLMIFPEGGQEMAKSLRTPLKKGIAYMALQAAEKMNFEEELYIVPAGVDYESYTKEGKHIYINFGEPIPVSPYYEQYQTNVKVAVKGLTEEVTTALQPLMIDVQKTEVYEEIMALNHIYKPILVNDKTIVGERPADKRFNAEKKLIATLEQAYDQNSEKIAHLGSQAIDYLAKIENLGFKHSIIRTGNYSFWQLVTQFLMLLLFLPLHVWGVLHNYLPYKISKTLALKNMPVHFHTTGIFAFSYFLFPIFYLIQTLIIGYFMGSWWWALLYILTLPFLGIFAANYWSFLKKWRAKCLFYRLKKQQNQALNDAILQKELIIEQVRKMCL